MHYFVTGATGFIGSRLVQRLVEEGHRVTALVRDVAKAANLTAQGMQLCQGDVTDKESMRTAITGVDGVFHLAALYTIGAQDNHRMQVTNVEGTRNVLELAQECNVTRVVYTSSTTVFSNTHGQVVDESYRHDASEGFLNAYERSKWLAHYQVAKLMVDAGAPVIIVLPSLVYGKDDTSSIGVLLREYLAKKLAFLPKETAYSWVHVEDVVQGHLLAMEKGEIGQEYILSGVNASLESGFELAQAITGIAAPRLRLPVPVMRAAQAMMQAANAFYPLHGSYHPETLHSVTGVTNLVTHAKASAALGYEARGLREGLKDVLEYELASLSS